MLRCKFKGYVGLSDKALFIAAVSVSFRVQGVYFALRIDFMQRPSDVFEYLTYTIYGVSCT